MVRQLGERPRERGRGGLVAGHQERHQLVAQLLVGHRRAVLVARLEQHAEDVVAVLVASRRRSSICSKISLSASSWSFTNVRHGPDPQHHLLQQAVLGRHHQAARAVAELEHRAEAVAQRVEPRARVEAEGGAQDDLEREPLGDGVQLDRLVARQGGHLALGDLLHQAGELGHLLAVEGRQHQLLLAHVRVAVEQEDGVAADDRLEHARALAGVQHVGRGGEHLLHLVGLREHHEVRGERQADREALAVLRPALLEEGDRAVPEPDPLDEGRVRRSRGKVRAHVYRMAYPSSARACVTVVT